MQELQGLSNFHHSRIRKGDYGLVINVSVHLEFRTHRKGCLVVILIEECRSCLHRRSPIDPELTLARKSIRNQKISGIVIRNSTRRSLAKCDFTEFVARRSVNIERSCTGAKTNHELSFDGGDGRIDIRVEVIRSAVAGLRVKVEERLDGLLVEAVSDFDRFSLLCHILILLAVMCTDDNLLRLVVVFRNTQVGHDFCMCRDLSLRLAGRKVIFGVEIDNTLIIVDKPIKQSHK